MTDEQTNSTRFRQMAERIDHNDPESFGGAYVIVPPGTGEHAIEVLVLDQHTDPIQFFKMLSEKVRVLMAELDRQETVARGFGAR